MTGNSVISGSWRAKIKNKAQLCVDEFTTASGLRSKKNKPFLFLFIFLQTTVETQSIRLSAQVCLVRFLAICCQLVEK